MSGSEESWEDFAANMDWAALGAELNELERTDPAVGAAAASLERVKAQITGREVPAMCVHVETDGTSWEHPAQSLPCGEVR